MIALRFLLLLALLGLLAGCATSLPPAGGLPPSARPEPIPPENNQQAAAPVASLPLPLPLRPAPTQVQPIPPALPAEAQIRTRALRYLPPNIPDRAGWASDIGAAFVHLRLPPSPENLCAAMAVIEQESGFRADPTVPGLGRIVEQEIEKRRQKYLIPRVLLDTALAKSSPDGKSYRYRIDHLNTERQMNALFEDMIAEIPFGRTLLSGYNPIRTGGPMQVSVAFAEEQARARGYPHAGAKNMRDEVFTRRGGVYFGIAILLDYPAPYADPIYRFADFNAGRYASRNAAFQSAVARLTRTRLALDGDLLAYANGRPSREMSATEKALRHLSGPLGLTAAEMRRDLLLEKNGAFGSTRLWQALFALADGKNGGRPVARELLPRILLKSPKITRRLTTEWFARRVDGRYRNCLERGRQSG